MKTGNLLTNRLNNHPYVGWSLSLHTSLMRFNFALGWPFCLFLFASRQLIPESIFVGNKLCKSFPANSSSILPLDHDNLSYPPGNCEWLIASLSWQQSLGKNARFTAGQPLQNAASMTADQLFAILIHFMQSKFQRVKTLSFWRWLPGCYLRVPNSEMSMFESDS